MQQKKKMSCGINICGGIPFSFAGNVYWNHMLWIFIVPKRCWLLNWMAPSIMKQREWSGIDSVHSTWNHWE